MNLARQAAVTSSLQALKFLARPAYSGTVIMEPTMFEKFISLCYRMGLTEAAGVQIHLVEMLSIFAESASPTVHCLRMSWPRRLSCRRRAKTYVLLSRITAGARAGMVAPDEVTFAYLRGRPLSPKGEEWDHAVSYWKTLKTDEGAKFDTEVNIPASDIIPPQDVVPITGVVPDPSSMADPVKRASALRSLTYTGLEPNTPMEQIKVDKVFIGSCTHSRIEDLRSAVNVILAASPDVKVAPNVHAMVVPGSAGNFIALGRVTSFPFLFLNVWYARRI